MERQTQDRTSSTLSKIERISSFGRWSSLDVQDNSLSSAAIPLGLCTALGQHISCSDSEEMCRTRYRKASHP